MDKRQAERALTNEWPGRIRVNSGLEEHKASREILKEIIVQPLEELGKLVDRIGRADETTLIQLKDLRYEIQPSVEEIEVLDRKIKGFVRGRNSRDEILKELKECRSSGT